MMVGYTIVGKEKSEIRGAELLYPEHRNLTHRTEVSQGSEQPEDLFSYFHTIEVPETGSDFIIIRVQEDDGNRVLLFRLVMNRTVLVADRKFGNISIRNAEFRVPEKIMQRFLSVQC